MRVFKIVICIRKTCTFFSHFFFFYIFSFKNDEQNYSFGYKGVPSRILHGIKRVYFLHKRGSIASFNFKLHPQTNERLVFKCFFDNHDILDLRLNKYIVYLINHLNVEVVKTSWLLLVVGVLQINNYGIDVVWCRM